MRILKATREDVPEIEGMCADLHPDIPGLSCYPYSAERMTRLLHAAIDDERNCYCLFVARSASDELAGMLFGNVERQFFSEALVAQNIIFLVKPRFRGTSAALRLLKAFANWARNRQVSALCVSQNSALDTQRFGRFMTRLGFVFVGSNYVLRLG